MEIRLKPGKYVLAVSGGVDSMALLDLLAKKPDIELLVAHFNHGIRPDSALDERLVAKTAKNLGLAFEVGYGKLGPQASEEVARIARYKYLYKIKAKHSAKAIITAHHQDDLIETAILNMLRGTNRKGLDALVKNPGVLRPLVNFSKSEIVNYAHTNKLEWRNDDTNQDTTYLRNRVRNSLSLLSSQKRGSLISNIDKVAKLNDEIDDQIAKLSQQLYSNTHIDRQKFANLPVAVGNELISHWLRQLQVTDLDSRTVNRINADLRTAKNGATQPIKGNMSIKYTLKSAQFILSVP